MTRDEIQELIEYLEKNYHVRCEYKQAIDEYDYWELRVYQTTPVFTDRGFGDSGSRDFIIGQLDALDLIRF